MRNIDIRIISQASHRYEGTCGDYWTDKDGVEQIRASFLPDWRHSMLIIFHEFIEKVETKAAGIKEEDITAFDIMFEEERERGLHGPHEEPGDDPRAPYREQHKSATTHEMILAQEIGVDWVEYNKAVEGLSNAE